MFRRCCTGLCAAATVGAREASPATASTEAAAGAKASPSIAETQFTLHTLYRRLLEAGEPGEMMQRCLSVNGLPQSVQYGVELLRYHKGLTEVDAQARSLSLLHPIKKTRLAFRRRVFAWKLFKLQMKLRSKNAISNMLVYLLFLTVCGLLYGIYRVCRVGVNRAEDRYRTLAIPIIQTFEALEEAQQRRNQLQAEMERDIRSQR